MKLTLCLFAFAAVFAVNVEARRGGGHKDDPNTETRRECFDGKVSSRYIVHFRPVSKVCSDSAPRACS
jgi:hypothetical protein